MLPMSTFHHHILAKHPSLCLDHRLALSDRWRPVGIGECTRRNQNQIQLVLRPLAISHDVFHAGPFTEGRTDWGEIWRPMRLTC